MSLKDDEASKSKAAQLESIPTKLASKRGAKSKYNEATVNTILEVLRRGASAKRACARAGISQETYYHWLRVYPEFLQQVQMAEQQAINIHVERINEASEDPRYWQASAWLLERRHPGEFGKKQVTAVLAEKLSNELLLKIRLNAPDIYDRVLEALGKDEPIP